jgi:hypothetical protein
MIEHVHEHILEEIRTNTRTDTIFVLTSILLNLITLAVNSAISGEENPNYVIMMIFTVLILVVNAVAVIGLLKGRSARSKLVEGLLRIYKDNEVEGYYDRSLLESYQTRYLLFMLVVVSTGLVAMIVPYTI